MWLNENSTKREILNYIEIDPFSFLYNFSDKPWSQPYMDEAVKLVAKKDPEYYLKHLADKFPQGIDTALFNLTS